MADRQVTGKTVRVRIAVAVDADGFWAARGCGGPEEWAQRRDSELEEAARKNGDIGGMDADSVVFVEADVPCPLKPNTVQGEVAK